MHSTQRKIVLVSFQLLAVILLQLPIFQPLMGKVFSSAARGVVCYHDHRLCGCSPERIARHTCCCARSAEDARTFADQKIDGSEGSCCNHRQRTKAMHSLLMAPCGAASPLYVSSVQDYLVFQGGGVISSPAIRQISSIEYPGNLRKGYFDPPEPPPKTLFSV
jgi:hypothetical protein